FFPLHLKDSAHPSLSFFVGRLAKCPSSIQVTRASNIQSLCFSYPTLASLTSIPSYERHAAPNLHAARWWDGMPTPPPRAIYLGYVASPAFPATQTPGLSVSRTHS